MSLAMRKRLDNMPAPIVAWLIAYGWVIDEGGQLVVARYRKGALGEAVLAASRMTRGCVEVPIP